MGIRRSELASRGRSVVYSVPYHTGGVGVRNGGMRLVHDVLMVLMVEA